jgi:hypothetical protein
MSTPHAGTFTAASGVHIHRGDALPPADRGSVFVCESAQNLVQRQVLAANGVTFTSRPARIGRDFLASRDTWFRPVFAANAPDAASSTIRNTCRKRAVRGSTSRPAGNAGGSTASPLPDGRGTPGRSIWDV